MLTVRLPGPRPHHLPIQATGRLLPQTAALDQHRTTFAHQQTILALQPTRPGGPNHSPRGLAHTSPQTKPAGNGTGTATWTAPTVTPADMSMHAPSAGQPTMGR